MPLEDLLDPDPDDPRLFRSCAGGVQGRSFSTLASVCTYWEEMHVVQKRHPTTCILGLADDTVGDDEPSKVCAWYADKADHQQKTLGLKENFTKAAIFSHAGDLDCVPAHIPGSPHSEGGTLDCFKAVGTYFGKDDACSAQVQARLAKKLAPLDQLDKARESEYVTNVGQLKHNLLRYNAAPIAGYAAQVTEPVVSSAGLAWADARIRRSWELAVSADASPAALRDDAWEQACLPSEGFGGCNISRSTCDVDTHGEPINLKYTSQFLACWPRLCRMLPCLHDVDPDDADAPRFVKSAVAGYEELRRRRLALVNKPQGLDKDVPHTKRGGKQTPYYPRGLPEADSLPPLAKLLDPTCKSKSPSQGKLAAVDNIHRWHKVRATLAQRDEDVKNNPKVGDSNVKSREQSRFVAVSQPYAGAWHAVPPDHTKATQLATPLWTSVMQRHLGLHLSALKPTLEELHEAGLEAGDYFGDKDTNDADHNRRHNGGMRGWYDAITAVATSQTVLGDKTNAAKTKQFNDFNDGHVVDIAEIGAGDSGEDVCNEFKCFTALKKTSSAASVGHKIGFGNTEGEARIANLGCKARGRPGDGPFDHKTGKGHVKFKKGEYHDALTVKRNEVCLLLHENLGGGFSPPAAHKIRRLGRKARSGIDRTPYKTDRKISFVSYHTRSISMNITRAEAWQLHKAVNTAKGDLCRHRDRNPTGGA